MALGCIAIAAVSWEQDVAPFSYSGLQDWVESQYSLWVWAFFLGAAEVVGFVQVLGLIVLLSFHTYLAISGQTTFTFLDMDYPDEYGEYDNASSLSKPAFIFQPGHPHVTTEEDADSTAVSLSEVAEDLSAATNDDTATSGGPGDADATSSAPPEPPPEPPPEVSEESPSDPTEEEVVENPILDPEIPAVEDEVEAKVEDA